MRPWPQFRPWWPQPIVPDDPRKALATNLAAMAQEVIGEHAGHHRFAHRHSADAHTRVVAALGQDVGLATLAIDGPAGGEDRRGRLHRKTHHDGLAGGNAAENAAGMVGEEFR